MQFFVLSCLNIIIKIFLCGSGYSNMLCKLFSVQQHICKCLADFLFKRPCLKYIHRCVCDRSR